MFGYATAAPSGLRRSLPPVAPVPEGIKEGCWRVDLMDEINSWGGGIMETLDWNDIGKRAAWTFAQAFFGTVAVGITTDVATYKAGAIAGVAAVLSLFKNIFAQTRAAKKA